MNHLFAISPIDGRYHNKTKSLSVYFSEFALIKYRVFVEIEYLCELNQQLNLNIPSINQVRQISERFSEKDAFTIKEIESVTNHDVKAVEYFIKQKLEDLKLKDFSEFVHFGLTSQDINNTAIPLSLKDWLIEEYKPKILDIIKNLRKISCDWWDVPMLAHTHGQPASPTRLGKEIMVFVERLEVQTKTLFESEFRCKFGGATGNFNAHYVSYSEIDWKNFANDFCKRLGLTRSQYTTQIEHYDTMASIFDNLKRINTILIDFCRDMWQYISLGYFVQSVKEGEVGSSAMPHKVNPIDFENSEGNLGISSALLTHLSEKLPISRLQRDLTDSTVLRNIGVPIGHIMISLDSIQKGLSKINCNKEKINEDLENNWMVVSEAIQTILRRESYPLPYEALKKLTRGKSVKQADIHIFIEELDINESVKSELKKITPQNYIGV